MSENVKPESLGERVVEAWYGGQYALTGKGPHADLAALVDRLAAPAAPGIREAAEACAAEQHPPDTIIGKRWADRFEEIIRERLSLRKMTAEEAERAYAEAEPVPLPPGFVDRVMAKLDADEIISRIRATTWDEEHDRETWALSRPAALELFSRLSAPARTGTEDEASLLRDPSTGHVVARLGEPAPPAVPEGARYVTHQPGSTDGPLSPPVPNEHARAVKKAEIRAALFPPPEPEPEAWEREAAREWIAETETGDYVGERDRLARHFAAARERARRKP